MDDVIQAALHDTQEHLAGVFGRARGQLKIPAELTLEDAVEPFQFLLFAQPDAIFARLAAPIAVHAGRNVAALDGALGTLAARALEKELHTFTAAESANRINLTSHISNNPNP